MTFGNAFFRGRSRSTKNSTRPNTVSVNFVSSYPCVYVTANFMTDLNVQVVIVREYISNGILWINIFFSNICRFMKFCRIPIPIPFSNCICFCIAYLMFRNRIVTHIVFFYQSVPKMFDTICPGVSRSPSVPKIRPFMLYSVHARSPIRKDITYRVGST